MDYVYHMVPKEMKRELLISQEEFELKEVLKSVI